MKNPANKGSNFERDICKQLSLWWTQDLDTPRNDIFWRTSQSGGRATQRAKSKLLTAYSYGDMTFIDPIGKPFIDLFLVEIKRGYTNKINPLDFLDSKKKHILIQDWWEKGEKEKDLASRKDTLIIFRRDQHKACMLFSRKLLTKLKTWFGTFESTLYLKTLQYNLVVILLSEFLDKCDPYIFDQESKDAPKEITPN
jgi:hypothetical protein